MLVALDIVDTHGLGALTIRRVADALGVYPTAVMHHVGSKDQLVEDTASLLFDNIELPNDQELVWDNWLRQAAHEWRSSMRKHPNLAPVIGNRLTVSPPALPFVERVLRVLAQSGLRDADLLHAYNTFMGCLIGWVSLELSRSVSAPEEVERNHRLALGHLDRNLFPVITANLNTLDNRAFMVRWANGDQNPLNDSFDVMINLVIEGIERMASTIGTRGA
nr:hypothetical protein ICEMyc226_00312 [Mycolicibacterium sp.]